MKPAYLLLPMLLMGICLSFGQSAQKNSKAADRMKTAERKVQQTIIQLEEKLCKAKMENNTAFIDELLTADYKGLNQYNVTSTRVQGIANWANRKNFVMTLDSVGVTIVSDTSAVAKGLQTEDGVPMKFERNYVKRNGKWLLASMRQKMLEYPGTRGIGRYRITGNISGADGVAVNLMSNSNSNLNAAIKKNGTFVMEGDAIEYPQLVFLVVPGSRERLAFFLENAEITITGKIDSVSKLQVSGSKTQDEYKTFLALSDDFKMELEKMMVEIRPLLQERDTAKISPYRKKMESMSSMVKVRQVEFVKNNPASYANQVILQGLMNGLKLPEFEALINSLDPNVARTRAIIDLKSRIREKKAVEVGQKAPDFTLNDVNGVPVSLSSKLGQKLLLVDFWAGWCAPCRAENPNVVRVYKEFKGKGFDILGVSLDRTKNEWTQAIAKDSLAWTQVSDLQYFNCAAARMYAVSAIPANFLLDKNGIIVAKNLRGEDLARKVRDLLNTR